MLFRSPQATQKERVMGYEFTNDPRDYNVVWLSFERRENEMAARARELGTNMSKIYFMSPLPAEGLPSAPCSCA